MSKIHAESGFVQRTKVTADKDAIDVAPVGRPPDAAITALLDARSFTPHAIRDVGQAILRGDAKTAVLPHSTELWGEADHVTLAMQRSQQVFDTYLPPDSFAFQVSGRGSPAQVRASILAAIKQETPNTFGVEGSQQQHDLWNAAHARNQTSLEQLAAIVAGDHNTEHPAFSQARIAAYQQVIDSMRKSIDASTKIELVAIERNVVANELDSDTSGDVVIKRSHRDDPSVAPHYVAVDDLGKATAGESSLHVHPVQELASIDVTNVDLGDHLNLPSSFEMRVYAGPVSPVKAMAFFELHGKKAVAPIFEFFAQRLARLDVSSSQYQSFDNAAQLRNFIGGALIETATHVPKLDSQGRISENDAERVTRDAFDYFRGNAAVEQIVEQIERQGGELPRASVVPLVHVDRSTGEVSLHTLFRVQDKTQRDDLTRYVDSNGRSYVNLTDFKLFNLLPDGKIFMPENGRFTRDEGSMDADGALKIDAFDSPNNATRSNIVHGADGASLPIALFGGHAGIALATAYAIFRGAEIVINPLMHGVTPSIAETSAACASVGISAFPALNVGAKAAQTAMASRTALHHSTQHAAIWAGGHGAVIAGSGHQSLSLSELALHRDELTPEQVASRMAALAFLSGRDMSQVQALINEMAANQGERRSRSGGSELH